MKKVTRRNWNKKETARTMLAIRTELAKGTSLVNAIENHAKLLDRTPSSVMNKYLKTKAKGNKINITPIAEHNKNLRLKITQENSRLLIEILTEKQKDELILKFVGL